MFLETWKKSTVLESGEWCHMNLSNERGPKHMKPLRRHCLGGHPAMQPWVHTKGFQIYVWHCWTYLEKMENGRERRQEWKLSDRLKDSCGSGKVVVSWTRETLEDIQRRGLIWKISNWVMELDNCYFMGCGRGKYNFDIQDAGLCEAGLTMGHWDNTERGIDFRRAGRLEREWEAWAQFLNVLKYFCQGRHVA